ncbi:MAG: glycoside hydrolase family 2 TIM barrel-domain containing protein, partial [Eubacteriales bacterium]|nr:glycoside hydrolase family 2 TIM barrel-domain containing protein [Eubacteriales bacterium]
MNAKLIKKCMAFGMAFSIGLSSWSHTVFADTPENSATQIRSVQEFVPISRLELKDGRNLLMDDWKFHLGEADSAEQNIFDDSKWSLVNLPHDYSIHQNYTASGEAESAYLPGGIGWYRKTFQVPAELQGKKVYIEFDGVYMNAEVYFNGRKLGVHPYGYTAFSFDLTGDLRVGEENVLAVKVNNNVPTSRWYSGSGIYRNVYLNVENLVHIEKDGVVVTTPNVSSNPTTPNVNVKVRVKNNADAAAAIGVKVDIRKKGTEAVLATTTLDAQDINGGQSMDFTAVLTVNNAQLWTLSNPDLYQAEVTVLRETEVLDKQVEDFGFRWFNFDAQNGFSLNGQNLKLQGVCMHHDQGSLGAAAYAEAISRQLDILKEMGVNAVRASHNPMSEDFVRLTNEKGILLIQEAFDTWTINKNGNRNDYGGFFKTVIGADNEILGKTAGMTWGEFDTKAMVKRDRNAPSVIMWSTGNEVLEGNDWGQPTGDYPNIVGRIATWMKQEDDTRPATIGDNKIKGNDWTAMSIARKLHELGGIIGYNYADSNQLSSGHSRNPQWKIYASETSSAVNSRGVYTHRNQSNQNFTLTSYDEKTVSWGQLASQDWYNVITKDYVAGNFVWTGFDYMGEPTPWNKTSAGLLNGIYNFPAPKSSYFGIVDLAGFPKDRYYFYSSQWRKDVTTLHLLPAWHQGIVNSANNVVVYSNAPKVKLFFTPQGTDNRQLVGEQTMTKVVTTAGHSYMTTGKENNHRDLYYRFSKPYEAGKLEVEAYDSQGDKIENTFGRNMVQTTGQPAKLKATVKKTELTADGRDLAYVEIDVLDADGNIVPTAQNNVTVRVSGAGELAAMDNGKQSDVTKFNAGHREAFSGKVLAIVRSKRENGSINVNISASGLEGTNVTLNASGAKEDSSDILGFRYSKNYYVKLSSQLTLPEQIKVVKKSGEENVNVVWDKTGLTDKLNTPGNFQVKGNVEGVGSVAVNVQVLDEVVALLNYSTYTRQGVVPSLPTVRPAVDKNDNILDAFFRVTWNEGQLAESRFATPGIVKVEGTATVFDNTFKVIATVRVVEAQVEYSASVTGAALEVRYDNSAFSDAEKLSDNDKNTVALATQTNGELEFTYATAVNIGRVVVHYTGTEPQVRPEWSLGSGLPYSGLNAKVSKETDKVIYDFQSVSAVGMKLKFANASNITEVELIPATESVTVNTKAELESLSVNDIPVATALLTLDEIPAAQEGVVKATGKDNTAVTVLPTKEKKAVLVLESEDHKTRLTKTVLLGQGQQDILLSTLPDAKAFAYFTNDKDPGSNDRIRYINDGKKEFQGDSTPRWSDWQRNNKLRENYIGIILPKEGDILPTVSQLMFMPFKDGGCQKPSRLEVQVYVGEDFEMPEENKLSQLREIPTHALATESNWKTVKTVEGSEIQDLAQNRIILPEAEETQAIRLKLKQTVSGQCLAAIELEVHGKYVEKEPVLISQRVSENKLPKAMASFSNDAKVDGNSADRIYLINDNRFGYTPSQAANRWTNWQRNPRTGTEWVGILFGKENTPSLHKVSYLDISFFEDNGCKIPQSFKVQYFSPKEAPEVPVQDFEGHVASTDFRNSQGVNVVNPNKSLALAQDSNWVDVEEVQGGTTKDEIRATEKNRVSFKPVETYALRILMTPQRRKSLAVTELEVYGLEVGGNGSTPTPQPQPEKDAHLKVFPSLREYETVDGSFEKAALKRMIIVDNDLAKKNNKAKEAVQLVNQEFAAYGIPN